MDVNDFDHLAPIYDRLAHLVFGDQLIRAQTHFLDIIEQNHSVLVLGGGTGKLLEFIPNCKSVDYVEKSSKMIEKAKSRNYKSQVSYVCEDFLDVIVASKYDIVICPFFLDCFGQKNLEEVLFKIKNILKPEGHLLVADFRKTASNTLILKIMHLFFRVFAKLETDKLLDINQYVVSSGFKLTGEKFLYHNRIFSRLYRNL